MDIEVNSNFQKSQYGVDGRWREKMNDSKWDKRVQSLVEGAKGANLT